MVGLRVRERVHVSSWTSKRLCRSIFVCLLTTRIMVLLMKMMLFRVKMPMTGTPIVQQTMMLSIWCHHCHVNDDVMCVLASIVRFSFVWRSRWQIRTQETDVWKSRTQQTMHFRFGSFVLFTKYGAQRAGSSNVNILMLVCNAFCGKCGHSVVVDI